MKYNFLPRLTACIVGDLFILILAFSTANAQNAYPAQRFNSKWAIAVNGGYDVLLGDFKDAYKTAPTVGISVLRRIDNFTISGTVDYRSYKTNGKPFEIPGGGGTTVESFYSDYSGTGLYANVVYNLPLPGRLIPYGGILTGYMFTNYTNTLFDGGNPFRKEYGTDGVAYVGPKLGVNYWISNKIGIGLEGRYSLNIVGINYQSNRGTNINKGHSTYAGNLFLTYNF